MPTTAGGGLASGDQGLGDRGVVKAHRVGLVEHERGLVIELGAQDDAQISVALDRLDLGPGGEQVSGERAEACADLDDRRGQGALWLQRPETGGDDLVVDLARVEKVLAPALARREIVAAQELTGRGDPLARAAHGVAQASSRATLERTSTCGARPLATWAAAAAAIIAALSPQ